MATTTTREYAKGEKKVTVQDFDAFPEAPADAKDVRRVVKDGVFTLTYTIADDEYQDGTGGQDTTPPGITITISGAVSQEPLATHPFFKDHITQEEWAKWKKYEDGDKTWDPWTEGSERMQAYAYKRGIGQDSFLDGGCTVRITQEELAKPDLTNLGKIQNPPYAPILPGARNYLLVGVDSTRSGRAGAWTVTREYRSSAPGGWDEDLYKS